MAASISKPCFLTIAEASRLIRDKKLSPVELAQSCLRRIEAINPQLNAFVTLTAETALAEAQTAEREIASGNYRGPLHGIPIGLKDLYATKGVRTTASSKVLLDWVPDEDATTVAMLKQAGAVLPGKLNTHEFAYGVTTAVSCFGPTRNPWDLSRSPGGSSGGSGAAIAASLCLGATGSDTGGSIRMPSSVCGVSGIKPTYGRVSRHGLVALAWSLDHAGPMGKAVEDCALMLTVMAGRDIRDAATADVPVPDYVASLGQSIRGLRLGVPRRFFFENADQEVLDAVEAAIGVLRDLGAEVRDCDIPDIDKYNLASSVIIRSEAAAYHEDWLKTRPEDYHPEIRTRLEMGRLIPATSYLRAQRFRTALIEKLRDVFAQVDALVTPTTPIPAPRIDEPSSEALRLGRFCGPFNLTGLPALSVPCGFTSNGLPIGLQIVGRAFDEETCLRVGHAYQQATDWHQRRPPI